MIYHWILMMIIDGNPTLPMAAYHDEATCKKHETKQFQCYGVQQLPEGQSIEDTTELCDRILGAEECARRRATQRIPKP